MSDVKQETANLCTMKYPKARSQTTTETADSPIVIQKNFKKIKEVKGSAKGSAEKPV